MRVYNNYLHMSLHQLSLFILVVCLISLVIIVCGGKVHCWWLGGTVSHLQLPPHILLSVT